jgi:hypothetical protein
LLFGVCQFLQEMFADLWANGFSLLGEHLHSSKIGAYGCTIFLLKQLFHTRGRHNGEEGLQDEDTQGSFLLARP